MSDRKTLFVDVILPLAVPNLYTYRIPFELNEQVKVGQRVVVQLGKSKLYTALIKTIHEQAPKQYEARYIDSVLDEEAIVNEQQFALWQWIANYYMCYPGEVMNAALPGGLKLSSESRIVLNTEAEFSSENLLQLNDREYLVIEALQNAQVLSLNEIAAITQLKNVHPFIKTLIAKKLVFSFEEVKEKYKPLQVPYVRMSDTYKNDEKKLKQLFDQLEKKAFKQLQVLLFYLEQVSGKSTDNLLLKDWVKRQDILKKTEAAPLNALLKKNVFVQQEFETGRLEYQDIQKQNKNLSSEQEIAFQCIKKAFLKKDVCLLHGVTGSGKTEVYCHLIDEALQAGKQVLYLLPEIALTTQLIYRVQHYFGDKVGVYHSRFSENERVEIWNSVLQSANSTVQVNHRHYQVILGARSALFLPFSKLGLIIIDEEHDTSYKQHDPAPRYNARDAAIYLAHLHDAKVVLGSATPSIETYYNARQDKYALVELNKRFGEATLPNIEVAENKAENRKGPPAILTETLKRGIAEALEKKEQIILFQNRRGFAPYTECQLCSWIPMCIQCDVALIYHKASNKLNCHYCGYTISPPSVCGACGSNDLRYKGFGTEKIEEEIEILFPEAKTARMDMDSTRSKHAYRQLISNFENGEIDILIGTQMVTKGLDFDHVSLVGIINADQMLNFPDYRAYERSFQLMTQVSGRAGRKAKKGRVLIQCTQAEHEIIRFVINNDYLQFYLHQLTDRKQFHYPPFFRLIEFTCVSTDIDLLNYSAKELAECLKRLFPGRVLGPEFPLVARIKNEYHKRIILKTERELASQQVREVLWAEVNKFRKNPMFKKVRLHIDADPL